MSTIISLKGNRIRETDSAVLFEVQDIAGNELEPSKTLWFPVSQIERSVLSKNKDEDVLIVSEWIATKKGLL